MLEFYHSSLHPSMHRPAVGGAGNKTNNSGRQGREIGKIGVGTKEERKGRRIERKKNKRGNKKGARE